MLGKAAANQEAVRVTPKHPAPQPTISKILFAVDFSSCSRHAAWFVRRFTQRYGARLWIVHAVIPRAFVHTDAAVRRADRRMAQFLESELLRDLSYEVVIRPGELWAVLSEILMEHAVDLIIAGTHGRSWWLGKIILGSAAELIVRNASCPVLTVGPQVDHHEDGYAIPRIVFPTDLECASDRALCRAIAVANEQNAQLIFLHVLHRRGLPVDYPDEEDIDDERYTDAMTRMKLFIPSSADFPRDPMVVIESGVPADCIVQVARDRGADLIAMSVRRVATATRSHIPWSTAYRIIASATCPVLTVGT